jgi:hypothetical protein
VDETLTTAPIEQAFATQGDTRIHHLRIELLLDQSRIASYV